MLGIRSGTVPPLAPADEQRPFAGRQVAVSGACVLPNALSQTHSCGPKVAVSFNNGRGCATVAGHAAYASRPVTVGESGFPVQQFDLAFSVCSFESKQPGKGYLLAVELAIQLSSRVR